MLLDHTIMCFIILPPLIIISLILISDQPFKNHPIETGAFYLMILVYLNKDFVQGKSIAKRILGLKIVDRKTGQSASELRCFLRNMTVPIWPVEILTTLFSKNRRIGDFIVNTRIEIAEKESAKSILTGLKNKKFTSVTLWTLIVGLAYMTVLWILMDELLKI